MFGQRNELQPRHLGRASVHFRTDLGRRENRSVHLEPVSSRRHWREQLRIDLGAVAQDLIPLDVSDPVAVIVVVVVIGRHGFLGYDLQAGRQLFGYG